MPGQFVQPMFGHKATSPLLPTATHMPARSMTANVAANAISSKHQRCDGQQEHVRDHRGLSDPPGSCPSSTVQVNKTPPVNGMPRLHEALTLSLFPAANPESGMTSRHLAPTELLARSLGLHGSTGNPKFEPRQLNFDCP